MNALARGGARVRTLGASRDHPLRCPAHGQRARLTGIVDFHSHLIPAVDDGAPDLERALEALRAFAAQRVSTCITTPHFDASLIRLPAAFAERMAAFDAGWARLRSACSGDADLPRIERGVELMLDDRDPDLSDPRLRLAGGPFVLVEFPSLQLPPNASDAVRNLRNRGWLPIIAHPERYRNHDARLTELRACRDAGALLQLNAGSLIGQHGKRAGALCWLLLEQGWGDYLASDHHARGTPATARALAELRARGAGEQATLLSEENPQRILRGEPPVTVAPYKAPQPSWWQRLFGLS